MNRLPDDPLFDAFLEEAIGGKSPPDLSARILGALQNGRAGAASSEAPPLEEAGLGAQSKESAPSAPPRLAGLDRAWTGAVAAGSAPSVNGRGRAPLGSGRRTPAARPKWRRPVWLTAAAGLLAAAFFTAAVTSSLWRPGAAPQADRRPSQVATRPTSPRPAKASAPRPAPAVAVADRAAAAEPETAFPTPGAAPSAAPLASDAAPAAQSPAPQVVAVPVSDPYDRPSPDTHVVAFVNDELARLWTEAGVSPAPPATDAEWCRRLFLRVLGRVPGVEDELQPFLADKSPDKRARLVDRLLTEDRYGEEYARHWSVVWSNVLVGRTGGRGGSLAKREGLEQYLRRALAQNKPYSQIVQELITASGSAHPGDEDYNPAVNFLLDRLDKDATLATGRVARVFLGVQLQCAQCHTHPSRDWSQEQFWALNAFLRPLRAERQGEKVWLVDAPLPAKGPTGQGLVFYETPSGLLKSATPKFLDGTPPPAAGDVPQARRSALAQLVVRSDLLPQALVNRVWAHFFGYGFTQPVDDLGPGTSATAPAVLDRLAREFAAHQYDVKRVLRWIALSEPFARSSKMTDLASKDLPEAGETPLFSRYYARPMQAEEVYNALVQAARIRQGTSGRAEIEKARVDWLAQFNRNMRTDDGQEESRFSGPGQALALMNGDLMRRAVSSQDAGLLKSLATSPMSFEKKVEHLFLTALSRPPTRRELAEAAKILAAGQNQETTALEDIWWALLNSNEFIIDH